jgi:hypothetical protein
MQVESQLLLLPIEGSQVVDDVAAADDQYTSLAKWG